ncbi:unnamed protein product [Brassicogethes aeneus]|uniref:C2H2-type domain-containing protein n=1 Tax=Brassicogethes aeneus TaxID=1431903 RepID=A0A9P0ASU4_BRAAE|nr:unnamed protein product [Brassicogethes aeneus]
MEIVDDYIANGTTPDVQAWPGLPPTHVTVACVINDMTKGRAGNGRVHSEEGSFNCQKCGKKYTQKEEFIRHIQFECGKQLVFQCPLCPRRCKRDDVLKIHLRNIHRID